MYRLVHDAYRAALAKLDVQVEYCAADNQSNSQRGPFFCFARRHRLDLLVGDHKLVGSAQRRIKNAVLQHGSLILNRHFPQQPCAALHEETKSPFDLNHFIADVTKSISNELHLKAINDNFTRTEQQHATILQNKYNGPDWNHQR